MLPLTAPQLANKLEALAGFDEVNLYLRGLFPLVGKTYMETKARPRYIIAERVGYEETS